MNITFDESYMGMKCKEMEVKEIETMVEKTLFELEIPTSKIRY